MIEKTSANRLAKLLGIPKSRGLEAVQKAQLNAGSHARGARRALRPPPKRRHGHPLGQPAESHIDRVLRLVEAAGLEADIRIRRAA